MDVSALAGILKGVVFGGRPRAFLRMFGFGLIFEKSHNF